MNKVFFASFLFTKKKCFPCLLCLLLRYRNEIDVRSHGPLRQSFLTLKEGMNGWCQGGTGGGGG
ncbi:hypothetical protein, partial [Acidiphilium sp.]|uniref:hypothetical protein n=1 Tax=Acidiphilium sp. TaxID=527 RepID=UPI00258D4CAE